MPIASKPSHHFFVVNPKSAGGATGRRWPDLAARLTQRLGPIAYALTQAPFDACELTSRALEEVRGRCVVAVGGDGTVNEVVNGFLKEGHPPDKTASLAVIPCGTGGDFGRTYGWTQQLEPAIARLERGEVRAIDVGRATFRAHSGGDASRYFANVCSLGVSGEIVREVNRSSKALGGRLSFAWSSLKTLRRYRDRWLRVSFDDGPPERMATTVLAAAIGRYFGGGMCVAPGADPSDGFFDVTIWSGYRASDFVLKASALYGGGHLRLEGTRTLRCRKLTVLPEDGDPRPIFLELDGEQPGTLPCILEILPRALRLKCDSQA